MVLFTCMITGVNPLEYIPGNIWHSCEQVSSFISMSVKAVAKAKFHGKLSYLTYLLTYLLTTFCVRHDKQMILSTTDTE